MDARVNREEIERTEALIRPYIRRTPVVELSGRDIGLDVPSVALKLEQLQHSGSFKTRGAFNHLLSRRTPEAGVVAASGGNHGVAVAFASQRLGKPARIFVPTVASQSKQDRIRQYGAELVITGDRYADALEASKQWAAQSGALEIHAYDQPETMLGQGTVGMECEQQVPDLDTLLVAVGGGGLIGGISAWYAGKIRLIGVEPESAPTLAMALQAGRPVDAPAGGIAADSLAPKRVGELMFPFAQAFVRNMVLVTDEAILAAQKALWELVRIVAEPGGAAAFAALLSGRYAPARGERVGVVICGGNTEVVQFPAGASKKSGETK